MVLLSLGYAVVEVLRTGRAGGGAYETLLPLNRESRVCVTVQPAAVSPSYSPWSRFGGGQSEELAQRWGGAWRNPLQRSGYQRCLSVPSDLLMEGRTDHLKFSDRKASALPIAPVPPGLTR